MSDDVLVTVESADSAGPRSARISIDSTLLDAVRSTGVEIEATCGARGRCRSCRIKVLDGDVSPPTVQETFQLGSEEVQERFRLACQTRVTGDCKVAPMPPRSESGHQILGGGNTAADSRLTVDSGVTKHLVRARTPTGEHHQTSDVEEILREVEGLKYEGLPIDVLRKVPRALRQHDGLLTVTLFGGRIIDLEAGDTTKHSYGMAFDVGTTSIVGTLLNLDTGEELASVSGLNPQAQYGGDLMSRIAYAQFDDKKLQTLRGKILNAINEFIDRACADAGVRAEHVYKIVVVGNTCMHHILLGIDVSYLGLAPYAPVVRSPLVFESRDLPLKAAPRAQVCLLPIVAGFVGADTIACLLATRLYESEEVRAFVDIGTNGEVVMGSRHRLVACSSPAGPALEGAQIRHGMRGAVGAVEKVRIDDDVQCQTIGGSPAIGICGSGLIDACARMIEAGVLDRTGLLRRSGLDQLPAQLRGRLREGSAGREFVLVPKEKAGRDYDICITQTDVRQIQLAKSAIYSGIVMLQSIMNVPNERLAELMLCGGFGNYISAASSVRIRLLPDLPLNRISYMGNAAATGAQMALLSETERLRAFELAQRIEHVALAGRPDFQDMFVEGMGFNGKAFPLERAAHAVSEPESA